MRILRWMCGDARKHRLKNKAIHRKMEVAPIKNKLKELKMVQTFKKQAKGYTSKSDLIHVEGQNDTGRVKITWNEVVKDRGRNQQCFIFQKVWP